MLFSDRFHEPIRRGEVTLTYRRWKRPQARTGGYYRLYSGGFIEASSVEVVQPSSVMIEDALAAGFDGVEELLGGLAPYEGDLYRIAFRYRGDLPDERALLAAQADLSDEERADILDRLARMDGGGRGAWTLDMLRLIAAYEGTRAADLAAMVGRETVRFKGDVRRLKALGLTESLEVGYRLSPRGLALLDGLVEAPAQ